MNPRFRPFFLALLALLVAVATGCGRERAEPPSAAAVAAGPLPPPTTPSADRAQIVTVSITLRVKDLRAAGDRVRAEIASRGGYVEGSNYVAGAEQQKKLRELRDEGRPAERPDAAPSSGR